MQNLPTRLKILMAMTDALKSITPANGYEDDLSESVFGGAIGTGRLTLSR